MGYRLMAWDGDFRTKDMFRASGREHSNFTKKKDAYDAAQRFMRTYPPKGADARVILEKTSSRWGSTVEEKWGHGPSGWTKASSDPRRRVRRDCVGVHTHGSLAPYMRDPGSNSKRIQAKDLHAGNVLVRRFNVYGEKEPDKKIETVQRGRTQVLVRFTTGSSHEYSPDDYVYVKRTTHHLAGDPGRRYGRPTREQRAFISRKIRILRKEHPRWSQAQVVATAYSMATEGTMKRYRRDMPALPKSMVTKKRAIERSIRSLGEAEHLDSNDRLAAVKKIYNAIDRLAHHARYKEGWDYQQSGELEDQLRREARVAYERAEENRRRALSRELSEARERENETRRERLSTPLGRYQEELRLHRGGVRDPRRRRR